MPRGTGVAGVTAAGAMIMAGPMLFVSLGGAVALYVVGFVCMFASLKPTIRLCRRVRQEEGEVCLNCHYSLRGLPDDGVCPECNEPFNKPEIRRLWRPWAGPFPPAQDQNGGELR
jgi:uncharacterized paraquat-inducible protein A